MAVKHKKKQEIIKDFKTHARDTGSAEVQIALLTRTKLEEDGGGVAKVGAAQYTMRVLPLT